MMEIERDLPFYVGQFVSETLDLPIISQMLHYQGLEYPTTQKNYECHEKL